MAANKKTRLLKWLIFGVLLALAPLASSWLFQLVSVQPSDLSSLLSQGELFLITAALCAGAVGEIIGSGNNRKLEKILAGGAALIILFVSALMFALLANPDILKTATQPETVKSASMVIYACAFIASATCIAISD